MNAGQIQRAGSLDQVRGGRPLEDVFVEAVGGRTDVGTELSWL
jgi:ABC-2 type transport system ATP-binding protein